MMKRLAVAVMLVILSAVMAFGAVQDFGKFSLDVPEGWTASQEGSVVLLNKNDNTAAMSITIDAVPAEVNGIDALAAAFAQEFAGSFKSVSTPEKDSDGDYSWDMMNAQDVNTHAMLTVKDGNYMLLTMTGAENAADDMSAILESVEEK